MFTRSDVSNSLLLLNICLILLTEAFFYKKWNNAASLLFSHRFLIFFYYILLPYSYTQLHELLAYPYEYVLILYNLALDLRFYELIYAYMAVIVAIYSAAYRRAEVSRLSILTVNLYSLAIFFPLMLFMQVVQERLFVFACSFLLSMLIAVSYFAMQSYKRNALAVNLRFELALKLVLVYASAILVFILADEINLFHNPGNNLVYATIILAVGFLLLASKKQILRLHYSKKYRYAYLSTILALAFVDQSIVFLIQCTLIFSFSMLKHIEWKKIYSTGHFSP